MDFARARKAMVDSQVRVNDVTDRALQAAMLAVPRERFCAPDRAHSAYAEVDAEIANGRRLMQARDVSKLLQALDARAGETALAIAAPYAGAVLARMGLAVTAQEDDAEVMAVVEPALVEAGVVPVLAPLDQPAGEGFDIVVSEGAVTQCPESWLAALKPGGRLVVVERDGRAGRALLFLKGQQGLSKRELFNAGPPMLASLGKAPAFAL